MCSLSAQLLRFLIEGVIMIEGKFKISRIINPGFDPKLKNALGLLYLNKRTTGLNRLKHFTTKNDRQIFFFFRSGLTGIT
jgi:hypothetical protein